MQLILEIWLWHQSSEINSITKTTQYTTRPGAYFKGYSVLNFVNIASMNYDMFTVALLDTFIESNTSSTYSGWMDIASTQWIYTLFYHEYRKKIFPLMTLCMLLNHNRRWRRWYTRHIHYCDVIMGAMASQITSLTIVYSIVHSGADQRKHQSSASLAFVWGIHRWPMNSPHKGPITQKMFPFDDVIMTKQIGAWIK